jgi:hypothetical protein
MQICEQIFGVATLPRSKDSGGDYRILKILIISYYLLICPVVRATHVKVLNSVIKYNHHFIGSSAELAFEVATVCRCLKGFGDA